MDYVVVPVDSPRVVTVAKRVADVRVSEIGVPGPRGFPGPQGERGPAGGSTATRKASIALSGHRVVMVDEFGGYNYASADNQSHALRVVGVTTGASEAGVDADAQLFGDITEPSWNWVDGIPIFLGLNGALTQTEPVQPISKFSLVVGFPITPTSMHVSIRQPISLL